MRGNGRRLIGRGREQTILINMSKIRYIDEVDWWEAGEGEARGKKKLEGEEREEMREERVDQWRNDWAVGEI